MLVYGGLFTSGKIAVRTDHGTFVARTASLRPVGFRGRAFIVELPGDAKPLSLETGGRKRARLRLPPANRRCGYREQVLSEF